MASTEQKRSDLKKALQAIDEDEMETVAGGLSEKAKIALRVGGALATVALLGYVAYKKPWGKNPSLTTTTSPVENCKLSNESPAVNYSLMGTAPPDKLPVMDYSLMGTAPPIELLYTDPSLAAYYQPYEY